MGLFDWLGAQIAHDAVHRTAIMLAPDRVTLPGKHPVAAVAGEHYVRLWMREMFLRQDQQWFTTRYPLAYSLIGLRYADTAVEIANVSGRNKLDIKQTDLGHQIQSNFILTPLLPFRGGTVEIDCGLVSMQASDVLRSFAGVVSDFAAKLNAPQVSAVIDLAAAVTSGLQSLLQAGETETKLYYHTTLTAQGGGAALQSGFIFLSEQPDGAMEAAKLWLTPEGLRYGATIGGAGALPAQDYMVIEVECLASRDDWQQLAVIDEPFHALQDALADGDADKAKLLLTQGIKAAQRCPDLNTLDIRRAIAALRAAYADRPEGDQPAMVKALATKALAATPRPTLSEAVAAISVEQARALPDE